MAHTPGPWLTMVDGVYALDENQRVNRFSAQISGGYISTNYRREGERTSREELAANARLIAAAPELLEALQMACAYLTELPHEAAHKIASAIAKATQS